MCVHHISRAGSEQYQVVDSSVQHSIYLGFGCTVQHSDTPQCRIVLHTQGQAPACNVVVHTLGLALACRLMVHTQGLAPACSIVTRMPAILVPVAPAGSILLKNHQLILIHYLLHTVS
jgi:hypothetical protein